MNRMYSGGACGCQSAGRPQMGGQTMCRPRGDGQTVTCQPTLGPSPELSLAMAYVPLQRWEALYEPEEGLRRGTMFQMLDMPWTVAGGGGCR